MPQALSTLQNSTQINERKTPPHRTRTCWLHRVLCSSQLIAATLTTPLSEDATFFHLGVSCWQWPHQGA